MFDLKGKTALITGATGGIGAEIAKTLYAAGARLVMTGTREEKLADLAASLGEGAYYTTCNLSDRSSVDALGPKAVELLGAPIDILVNNAGITRDNLAMRLKDEDWDAVLEVNLTSSFRLTRSLLRGMMKARFGRVINISSVVGSTGNPGQVNYCASKAGLEGMTRALAAEVASRGITVNCIAPGFIATPMTEVLSEDQKKSITAGIPSGLLGIGADIAAAVLYLASVEAGYTTGQTLHVNGGLAMY